MHIAFAYGIVAILTLWQIENIAERLLFRCAQPITLRDMGALVTFKSSTWIEVFGWAVRRPKRTKLSWRALHGIILRLVITVIDVLIIIAAIPMEVPVYESDVGSSELSFAADSIPLGFNVSEEISFSPCVSDNIPYKSFSATARRQICYNTSPRYDFRNDRRVSERLQRLPIGNDIFRIRIEKRTQQLTVLSLRSKSRFAINHMVIFTDDSKTDSDGESVESALQLKLPADIVKQAAQRLQRIPRIIRSCTITSNIAADVVRFKCSPEEKKNKLSLSKPDWFPRLLFEAAGTVKVKNSTKLSLLRRRKKTGRIIQIWNEPFQVGRVVRPRVCIYPALIVLGSLSLLSLLSIHIMPGANVSLSLWSWCSTASGSSNSCNPLRTDLEHDRAEFSIKSVSELVLGPDHQREILRN